jgi:hypothetical protein
MFSGYVISKDGRVGEAINGYIDDHEMQIPIVLVLITDPML